jgi:hypothetical protein
VKEVEQYFRLPNQEQIAKDKIRHDNEIIHEKAASSAHHQRDDYKVALTQDQQ